MLANDERRVPVPADAALAAAALGTAFAAAGANGRGLAALLLADDGPVLRHGVDDLGIVGIDARLHAVAAAVAVPVAGADAVLEQCPRRSAAGAVVLRAAVDVVE